MLFCVIYYCCTYDINHEGPRYKLFVFMCIDNQVVMCWSAWKRLLNINSLKHLFTLILRYRKFNLFMNYETDNDAY